MEAALARTCTWNAGQETGAGCVRVELSARGREAALERRPRTAPSNTCRAERTPSGLSPPPVPLSETGSNRCFLTGTLPGLRTS